MSEISPTKPPPEEGPSPSPSPVKRPLNEGEKKVVDKAKKTLAPEKGETTEAVEVPKEIRSPTPEESAPFETQVASQAVESVKEELKEKKEEHHSAFENVWIFPETEEA